MASLIPTSWLISGGGLVLLATTAGLGGLAEIPAEPVPAISLDQQYSGSDLEMTVQSVELRAQRGNAMVFPDEEAGEKVLAVTVRAVNTFPAPRSAASLSLTSPTVDGIRAIGFDAKPAISRADGSDGIVLQPDVPVELVLAWIVGPDDLHDGDELQLTLPDSTHRVGTNVMRGQDFWSDVVVGATLTAPVHEVAPVEAASADDGGAS